MQSLCRWLDMKNELENLFFFICFSFSKNPPRWIWTFSSIVLTIDYWGIFAHSKNHGLEGISHLIVGLSWYITAWHRYVVFKFINRSLNFSGMSLKELPTYLGIFCCDVFVNYNVIQCRWFPFFHWHVTFELCHQLTIHSYRLTNISPSYLL